MWMDIGADCCVSLYLGDLGERSIVTERSLLGRVSLPAVVDDVPRRAVEE